MREHKHLRKIRILLDVMYNWQTMGPTISEDELNDFQLELQEVEHIRDCCQEGINYKIQPSVLRRFNMYHKKYNKLKDHVWTTAN